MDRPPVRRLGLDVGFRAARNALGPPATPPRTPKKSGKAPASPTSRRQWAADRAASSPPLQTQQRPTQEERELRALDQRLCLHWGTPGVFVRDPEPDLVRPAARLEDAESPGAPRPGPYVIRAVEAFPAAGANILLDDYGPAPGPFLAQLAAGPSSPASPAAPFPEEGEDAVDDDEEDDAASRLASSIRAPSTSGTFFIVPIPNQPSPPDLSSTDSEDGP